MTSTASRNRRRIKVSDSERRPRSSIVAPVDVEGVQRPHLDDQPVDDPVDLQPFDRSSIARVEIDPPERDLAEDPIAVGDAAVHFECRLAERTLVLPQVVLELGVGPPGSALRTVSYERFGDEFVDSVEVTITPGSALPTFDDVDGVDHLVGRGIGAHPRSIAEPGVGAASGGSTPAHRGAYAAPMASLVLTLIGDDRAGLVNAVAQVVADHGGNWEHSQVAELAGKFAGIVLITVADDRADELVAALEPLTGLLDVTAHVAPGAATDHSTMYITLDIVGSDRPGIVSDITRVLTQHGVNIDSLTTITRDAPMAGGMLFEASAELGITPSVDLAALQHSLEQLANELMVDLALET